MNYENNSLIIAFIGGMLMSSGLLFDSFTVQGVNMAWFALGVEVVGVLIMSYAMGREQWERFFVPFIVLGLVLEIPANLFFGFTGIITYFPVIATSFLVAIWIGTLTGQNRKLKEQMKLLHNRVELLNVIEKM